MNVLETGLKSLGLNEKKIQEVLPLLEKYVLELELFNAAYDLVGTSSREEIYTRHILDSLAPVKILEERVKNEAFAEKTPRFVDIGSGAGLPGIPLAICFPEYSFTLLERMAKRCAFLENVVSVLQLKNTIVVQSEAEKYKGEAFDFAVFRAFRPLDKKMTKTILRLLKPNGLAFAYKAKKEKIDTEMKAIESLVGNWEVETLSLPFLDSLERHLVIFKDVNSSVQTQSK